MIYIHVYAVIWNIYKHMYTESLPNPNICIQNPCQIHSYNPQKFAP